MGMVGYYFKLEQSELDKVLSGEISLSSIAPDFSGNGYFDIDKSWMALSFTMMNTGEERAKYVVPMSDDSLIPSAMEEGYEFGAFYITASQVKETSAYLGEMSDEEFLQVYDFDQMASNNIYPIMSGDEEEAFLEYIQQYFSEIKDYFKTVSEENKVSSQREFLG